MGYKEKMADYLTRAEDLQMDLAEVSEAMNPQMFRALILKGLPSDFSQIVTVINYGQEKSVRTDEARSAKLRKLPAATLQLQKRYTAPVRLLKQNATTVGSRDTLQETADQLPNRSATTAT